MTARVCGPICMATPEYYKTNPKPAPPEAVADAALNSITLKVQVFKPGVIRDVMVAIGTAFVTSPSEYVWSDEILLPTMEVKDKNSVGLAWRLMAKTGMIQRLEGATDHRRSKAKERKGGVCWRYRVANLNLLRTFLERNGAAQPKLAQAALFEA